MEEFFAPEVKHQQKLNDIDFAAPGELEISNSDIENGISELIEISFCDYIHLSAAKCWLNKFKPNPSDSNIEKVQGYLESFYHFCQIKDWEYSWKILTIKPSSLNYQELSKRLFDWGYYEIVSKLYEEISNKFSDQQEEIICLNLIKCYLQLQNKKQLTIYMKKYWSIVKNENSLENVARSLKFLACCHQKLGNKGKVIEFLKQSLSIYNNIKNNPPNTFDGNLFIKRKAYLAICKNLKAMGDIYCAKNKYKKGILYYINSMNIAYLVEDEQLIIDLSVSLSDAYLKISQIQEALFYYNIYYKYLSKEKLNPMVLAKSYLKNIQDKFKSNKKEYYDFQDFIERKEKVIEKLLQYITMYKSINDFLKNYNDDDSNNKPIIKGYEVILNIEREFENKSGMLDCLSNLGKLYVLENKKEKSLKFYKEYLVISKEMGAIDKHNLCTALFEIANIYDEIGQHDKAIEHFQQFIDLEEEIEYLNTHIKDLNKNQKTFSKKFVAYYLNKLALDCWEATNYEQAINYFKKLITYSEKVNLQDYIFFAKQGIVVLFMIMGNKYYCEHQYFDSIKCYLKSAAMSLEAELIEELAESFHFSGHAYFRLKELHEALDKYKKALETYKFIKRKKMVMLCRLDIFLVKYEMIELHIKNKILSLVNFKNYIK